MYDIIYLCPSTPRGCCNWEGHQNDVVPHFEDNHKEYFLDTNSFDIDITEDNEVHYLMNALNETYLVQIKYIKSAQTVEIRIRYLGDASRAAKIFYHVEIMCGNFGFTSKNSGNGFETVTAKDGVIYVDVQAIKVTCGRRLIDSLLAWIHIENELNQYTYKSFKRRQYDNKTLESKARESFKRLSSYRTSMRKRSMDGIETVQTINKIIREKRKTSAVETPDLYQKFVGEIVEEIFRDAMDEIDFKEYELVNIESSNEELNDEEDVKQEAEDSTSLKLEDNQEIEAKVVTDVVEYKSQEDFINTIREKTNDQNLVNGDAVRNGENNRFSVQYEEVIVLKQNKNIHNLTIEISLPHFQEDVVSSVEVATHQTADTEYIDDDIDDLRARSVFAERTPRGCRGGLTYISSYVTVHKIDGNLAVSVSAASINTIRPKNEFATCSEERNDKSYVKIKRCFLYHVAVTRTYS